MSSKIESIITIAGEVSILPQDARRLTREHASDLPEGCFVREAARSHLLGTVPVRIAWYGEGATRTWEFFRDTVVPLLRVTVQFLVITEGGWEPEGFTISGGKLIPCDVEYKLTERK